MAGCEKLLQKEKSSSTFCEKICSCCAFYRQRQTCFAISDVNFVLGVILFYLLIFTFSTLFHWGCKNKLHVFVARFTVTLLTVQRIAWYLINILTMFTVPCACLISCNVGCDLFVHKNILGAMIIATLLSPILLCFSWATTRLKKWTRIYGKTMVECVKSPKDLTKVCIVNFFSSNTISIFRIFFFGGGGEGGGKMLENKYYNRAV